MKSRIILYADAGKVLTDGEIYGTEIYLGEDRTANEFREITVDEYNEILKAKEEALDK